MSATRRNVGEVVRLANLVGVLGWHAVVGVVCLARGRRGFEALQPGAIRWAVTIMLVTSVIVMAELVFRRREPGSDQLAPAEPGVRQLGLILGFAFALSATIGWAWTFWLSHGFAYDRLAAVFSRGLGATFDAETGGGFAGVPWVALLFVAGLGAFAWNTVRRAEAQLVAWPMASRGPLFKGVVCAGVALTLLAMGAAAHLSSGWLIAD
jgi:hypothetical protein